MKKSPSKCQWCEKVIPHKAKQVEVNVYTGRVKKDGDRRLRMLQWNFHARCFETCSSIPILPVEIKAVVRKSKLENEFIDPKEEKEEKAEDRETTVREGGEQGLV
jgi:hypothetical protein